MSNIPTQFTNLGFQSIAVDALTASSLTVPGGTRLAILRTEVSPIRWRDDYVDPQAGIGYPLGLTEELYYDGQINKLKLIAQAGTATVSINYYG